MDPRDRADAALARARSRGVYVVTPDDAVSPMDAVNTQQIPRGVVEAIDGQQNPDSTMVISGGVAAGQQSPQRQPAPQHQQQYPQQQMPTQPMQQPHPHPQQLPPMPQQHPPTQPMRQQQQQPPQPEPEPEPRQLDGLVPTVQQPGTQRGMLSRRLDGD